MSDKTATRLKLIFNKLDNHQAVCTLVQYRADVFFALHHPITHLAIRGRYEERARAEEEQARKGEDL